MIILQLDNEQLDSLIQNAVRKVNNEISKLQSHSGIEKPLNTKDAAEFLGISVNTIYGYTFRKEIPFSKKGKFNYFSKTDLIQWVKEGKRKMASELEAEVINETDTFLSRTGADKKKGSGRALKDKGISQELISVTFGHLNKKVTEKYLKAFEHCEINEVSQNKDVPQKENKLSIYKTKGGNDENK